MEGRGVRLEGIREVGRFALRVHARARAPTTQKQAIAGWEERRWRPGEVETGGGERASDGAAAVAAAAVHPHLNFGLVYVLCSAP